MRKSRHTLVIGLAVASALGTGSLHAQSLQEAAAAAGVSDIKSVEFSGTGRWFQFGQAPNPNSAWPAFDVKSYISDINYDTSSARVQYVRSQIVEPDRLRPAPVEQRGDQFISGSTAWNESTTGNAANAQPAAVEERAAEIWATPQGFLKAALANNATSTTVEGNTEVSFNVGGKYRYVGTINPYNQVIKVRTWIDNPVLGDTLVETKFSDYKDFGGIQFPSHIVRNQGGYPVLDINVASARKNPGVDIKVPQDLAKAPAVVVNSEKLAEGVYYLTGGTHHSLAIEQADHIAIIEAPLNEERSQAVIAKAKELIPNKPINFVINSHAHFDHAGGLRTFVDEGATIVTHQPNQAYYEKVWAHSHSLNPDRLEKSKKAARFEGFTGKHVLTDGKRPIEIHSIAGNGHNDAFVLVYLPNEKILVEADAYTPTAANVPPPAPANPYSVNLYDNIKKLNLSVDKIAALHGPRVVTLADLRAYIGLGEQQAAN
ncbi:MBL fold metallo-hydrolase [Methylococcus sp. EFPC2]|uniref:MBL fold metallo-hydrolase n=1 Tax=Methylococcus sp. EFPC2 TaxID=2812648 RepID=UPI0019684483|nr:MBL fold metallo-hydrolase [Methylococcus sp. EFPC2]QSA95477.1 MBL fold metallo-hydrolase [Methylococcus sp. EFPC2]